MSLAEYEEEPWPDDVPPPGALSPDDEEAEFAALEALHREAKRQHGIEQPKPALEPTTWEPQNPIALALWKRMPTNGSGVEYVRLVRQVADVGGWELRHVQVALLGLVLKGKAYVTKAPPPHDDASMAGRGDEPRTAGVAYRTGAMGGGW